MDLDSQLEESSETVESPKKDRKDISEWRMTTVEILPNKRIVAKGKIKGKHVRKTSDQQKKELIRFFEAHPNYVHIVAGTMGDSDMKKKIWNSVAKQLNMMGVGVQKDPGKWAKSWTDMKVYAKARAKAALTGKAPSNSRRPTELDRRILQVIGQEDLLTSWEAVCQDEIGETSGSTRRPILEHDYQITEYAEDEGDGTEQEILQEYEVAHEEQTHKVVKNLRDVMKQMKTDNESHLFELYIEDENAEYVENSEEEVEGEEEPPLKKMKRDSLNVPQVVEVREAPSDPVADALNNLAEAMNTVAGALYAAADAIKLLKGGGKSE